jgi:hypothetical protein
LIFKNIGDVFKNGACSLLQRTRRLCRRARLQAEKYLSPGKASKKMISFCFPVCGQENSAKLP